MGTKISACWALGIAYRQNPYLTDMKKILEKIPPNCGLGVVDVTNSVTIEVGGVGNNGTIHKRKHKWVFSAGN